MRIITAAVILATAAAATTTAFAQTPRLSDAQFLKVARCSGLAGDGRFDALYKANKRGRESVIMDRADASLRTAQREAKKASNGGKAQIEAELSGVCASLGA